MSKKRSYIMLSITAGLLVIIAGATFFYLDGSVGNAMERQTAFDRSEWKNGDERKRGTMIRDLINSDTLAGKNI